jgi:hypothetical protein
MTIPGKIEIQIIDSLGNPNPISNVLFGMKIFMKDGSWHNFSYFKTDRFGHIVLTKGDIIHNTELKSDVSLHLEISPKIELYVWEGPHTDYNIKRMQRLMELYDDEDFIKGDLRSHGVSEGTLPNAIRATQNKAAEDRTFYEWIRTVVNSSVNIYTDKIEDEWTDSSPRYYQFTIENRQ